MRGASPLRRRAQRRRAPPASHERPPAGIRTVTSHPSTTGCFWRDPRSILGLQPTRQPQMTKQHCSTGHPPRPSCRGPAQPPCARARPAPPPAPSPRPSGPPCPRGRRNRTPAGPTVCTTSHASARNSRKDPPLGARKAHATCLSEWSLPDASARTSCPGRARGAPSQRGHRRCAARLAAPRRRPRARQDAPEPALSWRRAQRAPFRKRAAAARTPAAAPRRLIPGTCFYDIVAARSPQPSPLTTHPHD